MEVTLLHNTPLEIADLAIGKCWDKPSKGAGHMIERIERVGNKNKHGSTLEHINYTFDIDGISRACLQEFRHQSLSVKSTRYTLKELQEWNGDFETLDKFLVLTGKAVVDAVNWKTLQEVSEYVGSISNDQAKYMLPEAYKTSLVSTMNMRGLQNFLKLRTNKAALWEIRDLANAMYEAIPDSHKFMLSSFVADLGEPNG